MGGIESMSRGVRSAPARRAPSRATLLGRVCFRDEPFVEPLLEAAAQVFTGHGGNVAGPTGLELDRLDGRIVVAVQADVALGFRERAESPHGPKGRTGVGRQNPGVAKEFRYAVDLTDTLRAEDGTPIGDNVAWTPEHLLLAALLRCSLKSLDHHTRRAGNTLTSQRGNASALFAKRASDGRYAATEIDVELVVRFRDQPGDDELLDLLAKAERDCFIGASLTAKPTYRWSVL